MLFLHCTNPCHWGWEPGDIPQQASMALSSSLLALPCAQDSSGTSQATRTNSTSLLLCL